MSSGRSRDGSAWTQYEPPIAIPGHKKILLLGLEVFDAVSS